MEQILYTVAQDWPEITLLVLSLGWLVRRFQPQIAALLPVAFKNYAEVKVTEKNTERIKELAELNNFYFQDSERTQWVSELQAQLGESNIFVRKLVIAKLDSILKGQEDIRELLYEVKDIQRFLLHEINEGSFLPQLEVKQDGHKGPEKEQEPV